MQPQPVWDALVVEPLINVLNSSTTIDASHSVTPEGNAMSITKPLLTNLSSSPELDGLINQVVRTTIDQLDSSISPAPFVRSKECARLIEVTPEHLCAMRSRGEGPPWSGEGKWVRYERSAVFDWIRNLPRERAPAGPEPADAPSLHVEREDSG
jgi:hypothetical protein